MDALMSHGNHVVVLDKLSSDSLRNVARWLDSSNFKFIKGDMLDAHEIIEALDGCCWALKQHEVIADFIRKLRKNPRELEVLGNGTQKKSYIYITDCVKALLLGLDAVHGYTEVFKVRSED